MKYLSFLKRRKKKKAPGWRKTRRNFDFTTSISAFLLRGHVSATRGPSRCDAPTCSRVKVVSVVRPLGWVIRAESCMQRRASERTSASFSTSNPVTVAAARRARNGSTNPRSLVHPRPDSAAFRMHQPGRPPSREAPSAMPNTARTRAAATRCDANSCGQIPLRPLVIMRIFIPFALFRSCYRFSLSLSLSLSLSCFSKILTDDMGGTFGFPLIRNPI